MANCCIRGCNSNSRANDEGLSFFRFPRTEALQKLWKDNIGTENIKPYKAGLVCSKHFEDTCINRTLEVVRLKDDVVPTIFPFTSSSRCSSSSGKHRGALAMNIAGNTTALLPVKMADDIDIEEHDVLDNPRIKNIFADITCITKTDVMKYEDEGINDFDEESYETYQQDLTDPEILERSVVLEECGDSLKYNPYFCSDCEILFPTENALNSHKMTAHSFLAAVGRNKAIKSTAKISIVARLKFETDSNTEISNLCNHCNKVFPDEISFLKHYEELLTRKFSCDDCDVEFESEMSLQQHSRTHPGVLMYCCPICFCYFKLSNKILSHMVDQHQVDMKEVPQRVETTYKCRFCPKILKDIKSYNIHIQCLHPDLYKKIVKDKTHTDKFKSQSSNLTFPSKSCIGSKAERLKLETDLNMELSNLYNYCNQVFPDEKSRRMFSCTVCNLAFDSKISLGQHLRTRFNCLLYCCPICSCYYKFMNKIVSHMVDQHQVDMKEVPQRVETTYKCRFCPKTFTDNRSYNYHIKNMHCEQYYKKSTKFECQPYCNLTFLSADSEKIHRVSQHAIEAQIYSTSIDLDEQIEIEPLSPTISHRLSQPVLKTYLKSIGLDEQIKIEPLSPTISHRLSQPVLKTYSKSISLDKQIKKEPLSHRVSQHEIEAEIYSTSIDLDEQIKIEPLSPTISHRLSQPVLKTYSKSISLDKQIKIEPLSHRVSQHEIEAETSSKSVDLDKQIKIEPLSPTIIHRVSQHEIEAETSSKSVDLDKQIKIEPLSPTIIHRVSQHEIEAETSSKSVDLDKQIKIEPLSPTISHRVSQHEIEAETSSKSVDLDKQIKIEPLSPKITQTVLKQKFIWRPVPKSTLFKCSKCQIHFVSSLVALEHTKRCALKKGNWKCKTCRIPFRLVDRHVHTMQHDWTDRFKILTVHENMSNSILCRCVSCKVCSDERTLIRSHERGCPISISFLCNMCNVNIHDKALTKHMKVHNEMDSESFVVVDFVNVDQSTLSSAIVIKPTIKNVKSKKPAKELKEHKFYYYCPTCRCYMKVQKLSDEHDSGKCNIHLKKRLCNLCGLTFSVRSFLSHKKYHKKFPHLKLKDLTFLSTQGGKKVNPPPPYFTKCVNCEVKYYRTLALNNHDCIGDEPKTCGYCGDIFSDFAYKLHVPFHEYAVERNTVIKNERMSDNPDKERAPKVTHRVSQQIEIESENYSKSVDLNKQIKIEPPSPTISRRVSQHAIKTYSKSVNLDKQIKIEPPSPTISRRVPQHAIKTYSKSVNLDKQINIEPLSPTIIHRVSQDEIEAETSWKSVDLDKQIKIEPLSPTITHRVSQHAIESETSSKSFDQDKQIKIEPLSPTISRRVSQHEIEAETYSKSVDLDKQIKIEPLSPTISRRVSQHAIEAETSSKSVDLDKQIKIEPLSPTISHRVSQHEIEAETYSKSVDLDKQIKIEPLSPTISRRVSQHEIEAETSSKSVDQDKQIKIEPPSPTISHRVSQHAIESETSSKSVDLDKQIKIEPPSPTISRRLSRPVIKTYSKSVNLNKQIKIEPLLPKITQTDLKQELR